MKRIIDYDSFKKTILEEESAFIFILLLGLGI